MARCHQDLAQLADGTASPGDVVSASRRELQIALEVICHPTKGFSIALLCIPSRFSPTGTMDPKVCGYARHHVFFALLTRDIALRALQ